MCVSKQLKEIEEHFKNTTQEELKRNLIQVGYGQIEPSGYSDMKIEDTCEMS